MILTDSYPFENRPLPYAYNALEPFIDARTMEVHHDLQAQAYVDNLNFLLKDDPVLQQLPLDQLIRAAQMMRISEGRPILRNAGGVFNHHFYFSQLQPPAADNQPRGALLTAIQQAYGSLDTMLTRLKAVALSVFGSGYAWLVATRDLALGMIITVNQETPLPLDLCPLLNIDAWEHAYYLKHYNNRAAYLDDLFQVINWSVVGERYASCPA